MSDPNKTRKPNTAEAAAAPEGNATTAATDTQPAQVTDGDRTVEPVAPAPASGTVSEAQAPASGTSSEVGPLAGAAERRAAAAPASPAPLPAPAPQPTAQVIDLDGVRAEERRATLAYVTEVHELCAIAGRIDLAAGFVAKATPVAQVRRALLEARAAEDEATAIRSQVRPAIVERAQPSIDTAAIYAARNQNAR